MGNAESVGIGGDRPENLIEEAKRNLSMGFPEAAALKFRRAYELHRENGLLASAASCLRQALEASLTGKEFNYELTAKGFEEVGLLYLKSEITVGAAASNFANSVYCLIAAGRVTTAKEKFSDFCKLDKEFAEDEEGVAARVILESFSNGNKNLTRDNFEGLKEVVEVSAWRQVLFTGVLTRL